VAAEGAARFEVHW